MNAIDPFARADQLDDSILEAMVQRLEARGRHPQFSNMLQEYLEAMGIDPAHGVLRLSFVHYTSEAEVTRLMAALDDLL